MTRKLILKNKRGAILIVTVLITIIILFLGIYFLSFSLTERTISKSQTWGAKAYYLAESGVHEMIWKLNNDPDFKDSFMTNGSWTGTFTRNNPFGDGSGSYTVTINNESPAHGDITAVGTINIGENTARREIKTKVYKAIGDGILSDITGYGDHDLKIHSLFGSVNYVNSSVYANHDVKVTGFITTVNIDNDLNAGHEFTKSYSCTVNVGGAIHTSTIPPAPEIIAIPGIDFDSNDPGSYENIADAVYTSAQFADLVDDNVDLILNDNITFVDGDVDFSGAKTLTINGLLVVNHDFDFGDDYCIGGSCGRPTLTVNHTEGQPSGIIVRHKIKFGVYTGNVNINGLLYSAQDILISGLPSDDGFNLNGGAVSGHDLIISGIVREINIHQNTENISGIITSSNFSPVITVEHWEEEY